MLTAIGVLGLLTSLACGSDAGSAAAGSGVSQGQFDALSKRVDELESELVVLRADVVLLDGGEADQQAAEGASGAEPGADATEPTTESTPEPTTDAPADGSAAAETPATDPASAGSADAGATETTIADAAPTDSAPPGEGAVEWTYAEAPDWAKLSPDYAACSTGKQQSPIDLGDPLPGDLADADYGYRQSPATVIDNGHTVEIDLAAGGSIELDLTQYQLVQFHFHSPSEHTIDHEHYPLEVHFVHKSAAGDLAVIGLFVEVGAENAAWDPIIQGLPAQVGVDTPMSAQIDATTLIPDVRAAYRYNGSLTTPPCTEGVEWSILIATISMSQGQIDAIKSHLREENDRPTQDLRGRQLKVDLTW